MWTLWDLILYPLISGESWCESFLSTLLLDLQDTLWSFSSKRGLSLFSEPHKTQRGRGLGLSWRGHGGSVQMTEDDSAGLKV